MISERVFRGTPPHMVFSYLLEILRTVGVEMMRQERSDRDGRFKGLIEGLNSGWPSVYVRVSLEGGEEPWSHVARNFIRVISTSRTVIETFEVFEGVQMDSEDSINLLRRLDSKMSMYLWHTSG